MTTPPPSGPVGPPYPNQPYSPTEVPAGGYFPPTQPPAGGYFPPPAEPVDPSQFGQPAPFGQPPAKTKPAWLRPVLIVAGLLVVGGLVFSMTRNSVENAVVGDCVQIKSDTEFVTVDCASAEAGYKVLSVEKGSGSGTCTSPDVDKKLYRPGSSAKSWCLQLVIKEGECLTSGSDKVDCAGATADYKVLKVVLNSQDETDCPTDAKRYRAYVADNKVLCLGAV